MSSLEAENNKAVFGKGTFMAYRTSTEGMSSTGLRVVLPFGGPWGEVGRDHWCCPCSLSLAGEHMGVLLSFLHCVL